MSTQNGNTTVSYDTSGSMGMRNPVTAGPTVSTVARRSGASRSGWPRPVVRALTVLAATAMLLVGAGLAAGGAQAAPTFGATLMHTPDTLPLSDKFVKFNLTVQNTATNGPGNATSGPVTVTFDLPTGMRAYLATRTGASQGQANRQDPVGWTCTNDVTSETCTRSDGLDGGSAYEGIELWVSVVGLTDNPATVTATVSGGGVAVPLVQHDSVAFTPGLSFGLVPGSFVARALNGAGDDETQAGGHPVSAVESFAFNQNVKTNGDTNTLDNVHSMTTQLPTGFVGSPQAIPKLCQNIQQILADSYATPSCPRASIVGGATANTGAGNFTRAPIYAVVPERGAPAQFVFGFPTAQVTYTLVPRLRPEDGYAVNVDAPAVSKSPTVKSIDVTLCGYGTNVAAHGFGSGFAGPETAFVSCKQPTDPDANPVPFLTNSPACGAKPPVTRLLVDSWQDRGAFKTYAAVAPAMTGCDQVRFTPSVSITPTTTVADAPTGLDVGITVPTDGLTSRDGIAQSHLKKAVVMLPAGVSVSPTAAHGLEGCTDAELAVGTDDEPSCPAGSKIGTVDITTPLLQEHLAGDVVLMTPKSTDPESGQMFRLAIIARSDVRGILVKLPGTATADSKTGRLVATFDNNPQLPFSDLKVKFKGGARGTLATPKACGSHAISTDLSPWSAPYAADAVSSSRFTIGCTPGLGWFGPYFSAGTVNPTAGASTSFVLRVNKPDGQSDMNGIALNLPEGLIASLKGNVGRQIGTARAGAGTGPDPFWLSGPVVLEGPYGDAPFSLRVTVPVIAGPFELGDVVVRQKIYVDPHDAHVTVVSDPLPTIWHGIPVRLQGLQVNIDKAGFMRNPTSCAVKAIGGTLGADTGQTAAVASRFQVGGCASLPLRPKMAMELKGKDQIKRGKHPEFSTTLTQQPGESNLKSVKVRLPLSLALDPDNAEALCKPEQAAAKACPATSIVGHATAISPVLNQPLTGDVFFVEGTRQSKQGRTVKTLPKLWVALRGEVAIDVWADSSISEGKYLVTTFGFIPDAPISSFKLDINGGKHGILAVTGDVGANLCQRRLITDASYVGQNGKRVESKVHMDSPCGFKVREKSVSISHARVTVSGIGAGKLTISGKGIHKASRTIKHSKVATITPRLTATGKRLYKGRKAMRLRVSFNPKAKGQKTKHTKTTVKRAKTSSSTRSHRSSRTR